MRRQLRQAGAGLKGYGRLLRYALADWKGWAFIVGVTLLSSAFDLLTPWPMKVLVDQVLGQEPMPESIARVVQVLPGGGTAGGLIAWVAGAGLAIFGVGSLMDVLLTRAWLRVGQGMVYRLAADLFARLLRRSLLFHRRNSVGDSMSRITGDSWCVYKLVDTLLFAPGHALITLIGMVVLMARMDPNLTLLALAVAPFLTGSSLLLGRPIRAAARARREIESRIQSHVQQTLSGIPVVQAFAREEHEQNRLRQFTEAAVRAQQRSTLVGGLSELASGLIVTLGTGLVLWFGARQVLRGELTVGSLLVFLAYLGSLQTQLKAFTGIHAALQEIGASVDRVHEVLEAVPEVSDRPGALTLRSARGHVRLEEVTFGYEPGRPVLQQVSLELPPGHIVALVGVSGAGKSTLAALLGRLFDPWQGRLTLDGIDFRDLRLA
ncbi:MAG TPA: ABC transporter ATP-binding protein, partial [Gemmataceae bacterium]|nr:ABC transporter ATP-binding protein [Gemmataceae bacterium]